MSLISLDYHNFFPLILDLLIHFDSMVIFCLAEGFSHLLPKLGDFPARTPLCHLPLLLPPAAVQPVSLPLSSALHPPWVPPITWSVSAR